MASQSTSDYYKKNPAAKRKRLAQQKAYNKNGSSKPGTKGITGNEIAKQANRLNRRLGTYGNGDNLDASHYAGSKTKGRLLPQSKNRASRLKIRRHA
tara:strand:+ start:1084 stop:1374 length:291 start_codon:yes stop_codon:yes gene_type:complete